MRRQRSDRGFTIIELMVALAIAAILMAVALPSYTAYVQRSKVPAGLDGLTTYAMRMEQRYQDSGTYGTGTTCGVALPTADNFVISCTMATGGQSYTATATGTGQMSGYIYSIDNNGTRVTVAHPKGVPSTNCWTTRGSTCDT